MVCLVEAARARGSGLSGVFARLELKLNPFHAAPWADALVVCHTTLGQACPHPIPWTRNLPTGGEQDWAFIVELDRATEPLATIGGKAREYATMIEDERWLQHWKNRLGPLPRILWVVPRDQRGEQVQRVWQEAWPSGRWYIATPEQLRSNSWQRSVAGERATVQFFRPPRQEASSSSQATTRTAPAAQAGQGANPAPQPAGVAASPIALPPSAATATAQTLRVGLLLTSERQTFAASDKRVQLLDAAGRVVSEATLQFGRAQLSLPAPEQAVRLRVPELRIEVALGAGRESIDLQLPEPPPPAPDPRFECQPGDEPRQWGDVAFERTIDQAYHACGAISRRVNKQSDELMQRAVDEGGAGHILIGLLLAYLSIFPVSLGFLGQALCVLLRGIVRLGRAVGWILGTVWRCAWDEPKQRALVVLGRTLLVLTFAVWLPLASWGYYDGELRSWPCESYFVSAELYAFPTPDSRQQPITLQPGSELRCFTRTAHDEHTTWRRVQVDDRKLWVEDRLLERIERP